MEKNLLTKHFDIYRSKNYLVCYFEIMMPTGEYLLYEFINHKIIEKNVWKLK